MLRKALTLGMVFILALSLLLVSMITCFTYDAEAHWAIFIADNFLTLVHSKTCISANAPRRVLVLPLFGLHIKIRHLRYAKSLTSGAFSIATYLLRYGCLVLSRIRANLSTNEFT